MDSCLKLQNSGTDEPDYSDHEGPVFTEKWSSDVSSAPVTGGSKPKKGRKSSILQGDIYDDLVCVENAKKRRRSTSNNFLKFHDENAEKLLNDYSDTKFKGRLWTLQMVYILNRTLYF